MSRLEFIIDPFAQRSLPEEGQQLAVHDLRVRPGDTVRSPSTTRWAPLISFAVRSTAAVMVSIRSESPCMTSVGMSMRGQVFCAKSLRKSSSIRMCICTQAAEAADSLKQMELNCASSGANLFAEPGLCRFRSESGVPYHEIRKALDLSRRLHQTTNADFSRDLSQSAWQCEGKVGLGDGNNARWPAPCH
jgi:hypothetical protein